jgi:hypothetical protein
VCRGNEAAEAGFCPQDIHRKFTGRCGEKQWALYRLMRASSSVLFVIWRGMVRRRQKNSAHERSACLSGHRISLSCTTIIRRLHRRTRHSSIRAEHAAIAFQGLQAFSAALAVVEELAGVGRHDLGGLMTALGAGDRRIKPHATKLGTLPAIRLDVRNSN